MGVTINGDGTITSTDGTVDFGDDNLATTGTIPAAQLTGTMPAVSGAAITALNASNLGSGSVPDARLPANLQSFPAPGSDGNVLTAASGAWTSAAAAGGGKLELIASLTASNSANLTFTGLTSHRAYLFIGTEIVPATSQNDAITLADTSGTFQTTYDGYVFGSNTAGAALTVTQKSSVSAMTVANLNAMSKKVPGVNTGYNYSFTLFRDTDATGGNAIFGNYSFASSSGALHSGFFCYKTQATYSLGQLKYALASGNITSGNFTCYGYDV